MYKVYAAGPIAGCTYTEAEGWRQYLRESLKECGIAVYSPLRGKGFLDDGHLINGSYNHPLATRRGIRGRDSFDVRTCDVMVVNVTGVLNLSGGTAWELGIAHALSKLVVFIVGALADELDNPYLTHPILRDEPAFVVHSLGEACDLLKAILMADPGELNAL